MLEDAPKSKLEQKGEINELRKAILDGDEGMVFKLLEKINEVLVGERGTYFLPEWSKEEIHALVNTQKPNVKIYLGDGGQSRLLITRIRNNISFHIGMSSTEEVKEKWRKLYGK